LNQVSQPPDFDEQLERLAERLPARAGKFVCWLGRPSSRWVRVPVAIVFVFGGFVGFLPIVGFWMTPLGLVLIAQDVPFLRPPLARLLAWVERKWFADAPPPRPR
jgi:hypothetical protein